jgi:hypothetical protein
MAELLPCPFCTSKAIEVEVIQNDCAWVECPACLSRGPEENTPERAAEAWNARTDLPDLPQTPSSPPAADDKDCVICHGDAQICVPAANCPRMARSPAAGVVEAPTSWEQIGWLRDYDVEGEEVTEICAQDDPGAYAIFRGVPPSTRSPTANEADTIAELTKNLFEQGETIERLTAELSRARSAVEEMRRTYDHLWVCQGCGTRKSIEQIKGEHPPAIACCPERRMAPVSSTEHAGD